MKKINTILKTLLICIACIDIIWLFFPGFTFRLYAMLVPIPLFMLFYFLTKETKNILYLIALTSLMVADYFFLIDGEKIENGIIATAIGMGLYGVIILIQSHYISTQRILINTVPFLLIYIIPFIFFVEKIPDALFSEIMTYTFAIGYLSFMAILTYMSKRNHVTKMLLIVGVSMTLMGILYGISLFINNNKLYGIGANMLFMISNYYMWRYMIVKDSLQSESGLI